MLVAIITSVLIILCPILSFGAFIDKRNDLIEKGKWNENTSVLIGIMVSMFNFVFCGVFLFLAFTHHLIIK